MKCVVCQMPKEKGQGDGGGSSSSQGRMGWAFTSERVAMTHTRIIFKLYEVTKREFRQGSICPSCFQLLVRADTVEFQLAQLHKAIRARAAADRMRGGSDGEEEEGEDEEEDLSIVEDVVQEEEDEEFRLGSEDEEEDEDEVKVTGSRSQKRRRKHREHSWPGLRAKVKREKVEFDEEQEETVMVPVQAAEQRLDVSSYLKVEHNIKHENPEQDEGKPLQQQPESPPPPPPPAPEANNSSSNLDFKVTVTRTTRGQEQLVYDGHTYLKSSTSSSSSAGGDIVRWKCTNYYSAKSGCAARLSTTLDGSCVLLDSLTPPEGHNHPAQAKGHLRALLFREQVRQIVGNHPEMGTAEVLANARALLQQSELEEDGEDALGIKNESLVRFIQRSRNRVKKKVAKDSNNPVVSQTSVQTSVAPALQQGVMPYVVQVRQDIS